MSHFDTIVAAKQEPRQALLRALRPRVERRMALYRAQAPHLQRMAQEDFEDDQRSILQHCYEVETGPLDRLKVAVQDNYRSASSGGSTRCPYCGINAPSTIDHYLPSSVFPELAVCHLNMLPSCGDCNREKGARWHHDGYRPCVHFYFDPLPEEDTYLRAKIILHSRGPEIGYELYLPASGDAQHFALYQRHCRSLRLIERFAMAAAEALPDIRDEITSWGSSIEHVRTCVLERLTRKQRRLGNNHWDTALWRAMSESRVFLDWCLGYTPEEPTRS